MTSTVDTIAETLGKTVEGITSEIQIARVISEVEAIEVAKKVEENTATKRGVVETRVKVRARIRGRSTFLALTM